MDITTICEGCSTTLLGFPQGPNCPTCGREFDPALVKMGMEGAPVQSDDPAILAVITRSEDDAKLAADQAELAALEAEIAALEAKDTLPPS